MGNPSAWNATRHKSPPGSTVRLLAIAQDFADFLSAEEREAAAHVTLPARMVSGRVTIADVLARANAFAAVVVEGMLLQQTQIGEQPALRVIGPGEIVAAGLAPRSELVAEYECRAVEQTKLAFLGIEFLAAAHHWPRLIAGLQSRTADGMDRLATQLAICQLPRVQDRLLAMLWLLAESWGHVTSSGTTLSLTLTHEALGALVGARRPTVTLALRELAQIGALVHQDRGWLLLEAPKVKLAGRSQIEDPHVLDDKPSRWSVNAEPDSPGTSQQSVLGDTLDRLRKDHLRSAEQLRASLREAAESRTNNAELRLRIQRDRRLLRSNSLNWVRRFA